MSDASKDELTRSLPAGVACTTERAACEVYASDESGRRGKAPEAIVHPRSVKSVQELMRWAAKQGVRLVPVSSPAGPRGHGDTVCDESSVILDMSGMNRVIHVDGRDAVAIIEPGVTFGALNQALRPHGLRAYQPLAPRASKSVLTAFLEREPMTVPGRHWDSMDPLAAMELVFGTGDVFRTGGAALPGKLEDNLERGNRNLVGVGPSFTDFGRVMSGAQGALGVATWASILCQRLPAVETPLFATAESLDPIVELCYRLLRRRPAGQLFIVNGVQLALMLAQSGAEYAALKGQLPSWILFVELSAPAYFPEEAIAYQRADLERDAAALKVTLREELAGRPAAALPERQRGFSDVADHRRAGLDRQDVFGLSQLDATGPQVEAIARLCSRSMELAIYFQPTTQGVNAHCQYGLLQPRGGENDLARLSIEAAEALADHRGFLSRPYYPWADVPFARDTGVRRILDLAKTIFDPGHVLQPHAMSLGGAL